MLNREDILFSCSSKYERKDGGGFFECSPGFNKNYISYMDKGAKEKNIIENYYLDNNELSGAFDDKGLIFNRIKEKEADVFKCRDNLRFGGVLEIKGINGYIHLNDYKDSLILMGKIKSTIASNLNISKDSLYFVSALHKNTVNRHVHFLFYSDVYEKKRIYFKDSDFMKLKDAVIGSALSFLNSKEHIEYLNNKYSDLSFSKNERIKLLEKRRFLDFQIKALEIIERVGKKDRGSASFKALDIITMCDIDELSKSLVFINEKNKNRYETLQTNITKIIKRGIEKKEAGETISFTFDLYNMLFSFPKEKTMELINEFSNRFRGVRFSKKMNLVKKVMGRKTLEDFAVKCKDIENLVTERTSYSIDKINFKMIDTYSLSLEKK